MTRQSPFTQSQVQVLLHPKQVAFTTSNRPVRSFMAGVGAGKTVIGAHDLLRRSKPRHTYMIVAPTYKMLQRSTLRTFIEGAEKLQLWDYEQYNKSESRCVLKNGAEVFLASGDTPDSLRGPSLSGCWLDECQNMSEEVYTVMVGRLREGGVRGWLSATFTPSTPDHWTSTTLLNKSDPDIEVIQCATCDNPFIKPEYFEFLKRQYSPARARRELYGELVYLEGAEWPPEWFEDGIWFDDWPNPTEGIRVVSLDSSKGRGGKTGDYSSFCLIHWHDHTLWTDFDLANDRDSSIIAQTAIDIQRRWNPHFFAIEEEFGGATLLADIQRRADDLRLPMAVTLLGSDQIQKEVRIRRLTPYLSQGMMRFKRNSPSAKLAVDQIRSFPQAAHDDGPDSAEMAVRMLEKINAGLVQW